MLLASATARATGIIRDHSLATVANVDDEEITVLTMVLATVLTTSTVGVEPGEAGNVVVPAAVEAAAGVLSSVTPSILQYPL
jgi:uncharacterized membrane protein YeiH